MTSNKEVFYTFNPKEINWKFKVKKSNRRMKLYIKMTKAETGQYEELAKAAKPPEMSNDDFAKILFYKGIDSFMSQLTEHINNMPQEEKDKLMSQVEEKDDRPEPTREELAAKGKAIIEETNKSDGKEA
tara:strand:- start:509 stop:895 length:387 start_codon:yes stop_codon:yes gene_type:complete